MKFQYLKELLGNTSYSSCNDVSGCELLGYGIDKTENSILWNKYSEFNIPFEYIKISKGDIVVNLISDTGYELYKLSEKTGDKGKVISIDFSPAMMYRAGYNVRKSGFRNIYFREIKSEYLPLGAHTVDVIVINKVLGFYPENDLLCEVSRILKPEGKFYIYDIVPDKTTDGLITKDVYMDKLNSCFSNVSATNSTNKKLTTENIITKKKLHISPNVNLSAVLFSGKQFKDL